MSQARNVCFTLNNYTEKELKDILEWKCSYLICGREVGESGTPHIQGYVEWGRGVRFTTMKKLNERIHWETRKGTAKQASDYCKKDGNFEERGELSSQGHRTDLDEIKTSIENGRKVDDICMDSPMVYHQYGRTLNKIEDLVMRKKYRTHMTKGIWYWGSTGVGKSHAAYENFHPDTHYTLPNDNGWWDGYTQQETVIINDFRGEIPYNQLLQMVDKFPFSVRRRNREPLPFTSKTVIITSSLPPQLVYKNREAEDSLEQLLRRFDIIELKKDCDATEVVGGNTIPLPDALEEFLKE